MRLLSPPVLTTLALVFAVVGQFDAAAAQKYWCGKPYQPKSPHKRDLSLLRRGPTTASSGTDGQIVLPPTKDPLPEVPDLSKGYAAMVRVQPYLDDEDNASLVVNVAQSEGAVSVAVALEDGTVLRQKKEIKVSDAAVEVPFSIGDVKPQLQPYNIKVSFYLGDNKSPVHETIAKLYRLPKGPVTVKIDRLYGTTIGPDNDVVFPVGPYVDFGWLGQGDITGNLKKLRGMGFNIINPDPTYTDLSLIENVLKAADELGGFYIQLSFRYSFTNIDQVLAQINRFKKYKSVLTWYTSDEPDGEQWTDSTAIRNIYAAIKKADPYRPVSLVLNCERTAPFYVDATDILGVDVYPVGVDVSHCTETDDVCGCDNCLGSATKDIPKRTAQFMKDLTLVGRQAVPRWKVLQAFSDPPTWWQRMPTPLEYRFMAWQSIILGYKSIMQWKYPSVPDTSLEDTVSQVARETTKYSPYFLQSLQLPASHLSFENDADGYYASAWLSADRKSFFAVVANGNEKGKGTFSLTIEDLKNVQPLKGTAVAAKGNSDVTIENGVLPGTLNGLGVGIYVFGNVPQASLISGDDENSGSENNGDKSNGSSTVPLSVSSFLSLAIVVSSIAGYLL